MTPLEKLRYLGLRPALHKLGARVAGAVTPRLRRSPALAPADPALALRLTLLGHDFDLRDEGRWHRSPDTGQRWPLTYGPALPLTGPAAAGDVKLIWELNRLQFLPELAATDPALAARVLHDWRGQNPVGFGVNWSSGLEVGLRLIALRETLDRLPRLQPEFAPLLAHHARFIRRHLSDHWIPRNNHLIGEAAALTVAGWSTPWLDQAIAEQFYASGVHREHAVAYHQFVTHLLALAGRPLPKAVAYLAAIRQPDGSLPNCGDSDDGLATRQPLALPPGPAQSAAYPDAGHYVIRQGGDYCFVRCGEFGLPPPCAHAHADLLSPILWVAGQPVVVDAGTFTYNGDADLRRQFRSAHAHNVLVVDGHDQAEPDGTFAWRNAPCGVCESWGAQEFVGRVGSWRRTIRHAPGRFTITDQAPAGRLRWRFHLHPSLKITRCGDGAFVFGRFTLTAPGTLRVAEGWLSPSYHRRVVVDVCEIALDAPAPVTAEFVIQ